MMEDIVTKSNSQGLTRSQICSALSQLGINISTKHLRRVLRKLNLSRRKDYSDIGKEAVFINNIVTSGQQRGNHWIYYKLQDCGFRVRKEDAKYDPVSFGHQGSDFRKKKGYNVEYTVLKALIICCTWIVMIK